MKKKLKGLKHMICAALVLGTIAFTGSTVNATEVATPEAPIADTEDNDSQTNAGAIELNTTYAGVMSSGSDIDWYKFEIPAGSEGYFQVNLKPDSNANHSLIAAGWDWFIYKAGESEPLWSVEDCNDDTTTLKFPFDSGVYYIKLSMGYAFNAATYEYYNVTVNTTTKSDNTGKKVTFIAPKSNKKKSVTVPATVTIDGDTYKVTAISDKAFKGNKKLSSVTIGKNVTKIGKEAFCNCKNLKKITIKSTVLKSVGKNAIKGINKKAVIKVSSKQYSKYKKLFKSKTGYKKTMVIKKS